jgi:anti-anti-sigma regulatory factor
MDQNNCPAANAAVTLEFDGELIVANAEKIRGQLISALEQNQAILVDCSQATAADVSFIQIMIAAERTAASWGKTVSFLPFSKAVETALESGGFIRDAIPRGNDKAVAQQRA